MPILESVAKLSDYLDRQALREKEKRKERLLTILPTYLERQISGIQDEKTLYSTLPKLSAQLYSFGADVGAAGSQILGGLAQTKYNELVTAKTERINKETVEATSEIYKGMVGDKDFQDVVGKLGGYSPEVAKEIAAPLFESRRKTETGIGMNEGGRLFFQSYELDKSGKGTPKVKYEFKKGKDGYTLDDPNTAGPDNLPLTMEAAKFLQDQLSEEAKFKRQLQLQYSQYSIATNKQEEALINQIRKRQFKDLDTGEAVYADYDTKTKMPYLYKMKETPNQSFGTVVYGKDGKPFFGTTQTRERVTDYSRIEELGQGFYKPGSEDIQATDVNTTEGIYNNRLTRVANNLVNSGDLEAKLQGQYWSHDEVVKKLRDLGRNAEADELDLLFAKVNQTQNSYLGIGQGQQSTTKKPLGNW